MKKILSIIALALAASTPVTFAQTPSTSGTAATPPAEEQGKGAKQRQRPPLIAALDANKDGAIDAQEITNATAALKTLDKNGDGQLTRDELRPQRPGFLGGKAGKALKAGKGGIKHERPPLIAALDANADGVIDVQEITNAPAALKTLDKNGDGQLTRDEFRRLHGPAATGAEQPKKHGKKRSPAAPAVTPEATPADTTTPVKL